MEINKPISTALIFIIMLVAVFLFVLPKAGDSSVLEIELATKQAEYDGKSVYYQRINEIIQSLAVKEESVGKIASALPQDASVASLAYFLDQKANETGMIIRSVNITHSSATVTKAGSAAARQQPPNQVKDISLALNMAGSAQAFKNFLYELENSARLFEINTMGFASVGSQSTSTNEKNQSTYSFTLDIKTHTY